MATSTTSNKRHSVLPPISQAGPKPPVNFSSSITISESAVLTGTGTITVGGECVIHPRARLDSSTGDVTIGRRCIIYERSFIGDSDGPDGSGSRTGKGGDGEDDEDRVPPLRSAAGVSLGDYVTIEVGAVIEGGGTVVGEASVIGVGSRIGRGAVIGKNCTVTARTVVPAGDVLPDLTVVFPDGSRRKDRSRMAELRTKLQTRQLEVVRRIIPSNPAKFQ